MSKTTRRIRRVDETLRASQRRRMTQSEQLRGGGEGRGSGDPGGTRVAATAGRGWFPVLALAVVILGLAVYVLWPSGGAPGGETLAQVAVVERVRGPVLSSTPGATRLLPLTPSGVLRAGDVVETRPAEGAFAAAGGGGGRLALRLASGSSVRLDEESRVQLASDHAVVLDRGAVYVDARAVGTAVEVRTTLGVVRDIGTQFEVRLVEEGGAALRVRVREGEVVLERGETTHHAGLGEQLLMRTDGSVARSEVSVWGPEWDWVLVAAPVPPFAGQTLADFVDWLAREGGWTVRWEDDRLAALAPTVALGGSSRGLSALEAAEVVFSGTTDFSYRIDREAGLLSIVGRVETGEGE